MSSLQCNLDLLKNFGKILMIFSFLGRFWWFFSILGQFWWFFNIWCLSIFSKKIFHFWVFQSRFRSQFRSRFWWSRFRRSWFRWSRFRPSRFIRSQFWQSQFRRSRFRRSRFRRKLTSIVLYYKIFLNPGSWLLGWGDICSNYIWNFLDSLYFYSFRLRSSSMTFFK